jgi:hypothetical protein
LARPYQGEEKVEFRESIRTLTIAFVTGTNAFLVGSRCTP